MFSAARTAKATRRTSEIIAGRARRAESRNRLSAESERDKWQRQRVNVPSQQQRRASLDQQLAEAPFLYEYRHAVKNERRAERVHDALAGYLVGIVVVVSG